MIASLFQKVTFQPEDELRLVAIDPQTRFAILMGENGPERVDSAFRKIPVPVFPWPTQRVERHLAQLLLEASAARPLQVASMQSLNDEFWVRNRGWLAVLCHPDAIGKFVIPDGLQVETSEEMPMDRLVLTGEPSRVGILVQQGLRYGAVSNNVQALLQLQFAS